MKMETMKNKTTERLPRGIRLKNPLNIVHNPKNRWHGLTNVPKGERFCVFEDYQWGFRAAAILLKKYVDVYKCNTIRLIVAKWAPATENNVKAYTDFVAQTTGIDADATIEFSNTMAMLSIMSAMCQMENGVRWNPQKKTELWQKLYKGYMMARENRTDDD